MANSPQLETYRLFYEHIPVSKSAVKKIARKRKTRRSLLDTPAK